MSRFQGRGATLADALVIDDTDDDMEDIQPAVLRPSMDVSDMRNPLALARRTPPAPTASTRITTVRHSSGSKINEPPQSASKAANCLRHPGRHFSSHTLSAEVIQTTPANAEPRKEEAEQMPLGSDHIHSTGSPSNRPSSRTIGSKASSERSIGSISPLAIRPGRSKTVHSLPRVPPDPTPKEVVSIRSVLNEAASSEPIQPQQSVLMGKPHELTLSVKQLEESLKRFEKSVKEVYSENAKLLLQDSWMSVRDVQPLFEENDSPFASMESVQALPGGIIPPELSTIKMESYVTKRKLIRTRRQLFAKTIRSDVARVPRYSGHTNVKRNILSGDDEKLKFIPFLGDADDAKKQAALKKLQKELEGAYAAKSSGSSRESERASQSLRCLTGWLDSLGSNCNIDTLTCYILQEDDCIDGLGLRRKEKHLIVKSLGSPLSPAVVEMAEKICEAWEAHFQFPLTHVILQKDRIKELLDSVRKDNYTSTTETSNDPQHVLETYTTMACLICHAICCQTHGDYNNRPVASLDDSDEDVSNKDEYYNNHEPLIMLYDDIVRKHDRRVSLEIPTTAKSPTPCSRECYLKREHEAEVVKLPDKDRGLLESLLVSKLRHANHSCDIAFVIDQPCWQVYNIMLQVAPRNPEPEPSGPVKRLDWYDNKRKTLKWDWLDLTTAHLHQLRRQANPCAHPGPCQQNCPCFQENLLCESYCGCSDTCPRKFTGCSCHSNGTACTEGTGCICVQMNRECGPECSSCGAVERINPFNKFNDVLFTTGCQNIVLQRGVTKKLIIGESQLEEAGFGAYLGEPAQKGDFLSEYAGEAISFAEAERRGIIYDRKYMSFLFDLNSEWCIDAARLGNKTRFINHAEDPESGLNCEAKILLVNGEHRIKFVALRDIAVGEELLFNYGKKFAEKHGLDKKLPPPQKKRGGKGEAGGGKTKPVAEVNVEGTTMKGQGKEALEGIVTRGKMTAIRGGHGGMGRGKGKRARKVAPITSSPTNEDVDIMEEVVMLEDDEDDEDEDIRDFSGKRKRRSVKPLRYTR